MKVESYQDENSPPYSQTMQNVQFKPNLVQDSNSDSRDSNFDQLERIKQDYGEQQPQKKKDFPKVMRGFGDDSGDDLMSSPDMSSD